jgi:hypothetical protein
MMRRPAGADNTNEITTKIPKAKPSRIGGLIQGRSLIRIKVGAD